MGTGMPSSTVSNAARTMAQKRSEKLGPKRRKQIARDATMARWYETCRDCDGCGWYEGGKTLKTTCPSCEGSGLVRRRK